MSIEDDSGNKSVQINEKIERIKPFQWKPGQSGNPGGRPKKSKEFRNAVRETIDAGVVLLRSRIMSGEIGSADLVAALKGLTKHAGYLSPDELASLEASYAKLVLAISDSSQLDADKKKEAIAQVDSVHREALGEEDEG